MPGPLRLLAPLSTSQVTSSTPTLHWVLPQEADGALVELFHDRAGTAPIAVFQATGTSGKPDVALSAGVVFWRVTATSGETVVGVPSAVWQFTVGHGSATVDTSWGTTLDVNGDGFADVAVGAPDVNAAYVYLGSALGLSTTPTVLSVTSTGGSFGSSMVSVGDINGDGFGDLAIGGTNPGLLLGFMYVYLGSVTGVSSAPTKIVYDVESNEWGEGPTEIVGAGDLNGDGFADIAISTIGGQTGPGESGNVYLYMGGLTGVSSTPISLPPPANSSNAGFGASLVSAGDLNGDGFSDLVVCSAYADASAYVYLGGPNGLLSFPPVTLGPSSTSGQVEGGAGDFNGDGFADLVLSEPSSNSTDLYFGSAAGLSLSPLSLPWYLGSAATVDINGDGFSDLLSGTLGTVSVKLGGPSGLSSATFSFNDPTSGPEDYFGYVIASAGDIDGDGFAAFLIGAAGTDNNRGVVYVYQGSAAGPVTPPTLLTGPAESSFGAAVQ